MKRFSNKKHYELSAVLRDKIFTTADGERVFYSHYIHNCKDITTYCFIKERDKNKYFADCCYISVTKWYDDYTRAGYFEEVIKGIEEFKGVMHE